MRRGRSRRRGREWRDASSKNLLWKVEGGRRRVPNANGGGDRDVPFAAHPARTCAAARRRQVERRAPAEHTTPRTCGSGGALLDAPERPHEPREELLAPEPRELEREGVGAADFRLELHVVEGRGHALHPRDGVIP